MGLRPLEFAECLTDSPYFRENLHEHEKELERTSKSIKSLIACGKELINAARNLSKAQKAFSQNLQEFRFETIGNQQTDDEVVIAASLKEFGDCFLAIEEVFERMLDKAKDMFLAPLERFRKENIGKAKEEKKQFEKQTSKFCASQERYLNLKPKTNDTTFQEADAALVLEGKHFYQASMKYVLLLQEVQEKKKFDFVEIILTFISNWLTVYHQGHEVAKEFKTNMSDLQLRLQNTRENFNSTRDEAELLMNKMLETRGSRGEFTLAPKDCTRQGYLFLMEKKALGTNWTKCYCRYFKEHKTFSMIPYNQMVGKLSQPETGILMSCIRRASDSIDKRFCFDITISDKPTVIFTFQALSEDDRHLWLDAMDGKEPTYQTPSKTSEETYILDSIGFQFINKCIGSIERRGLTDQGLYRLVGVNSKVNRLVNMGLDRRKADKLCLDDTGTWEVKTITSSIKHYLRSLPEPLMTFRLHENFITAAKRESKLLRFHDIHSLVHKLPQKNFKMLDLLCSHLKRVSDKSDINLMTVANLGVCFGPTLMRPEEETVAAIMDIKFCNIVIEILIGNYEEIFKQTPVDIGLLDDLEDCKLSPAESTTTTKTSLENQALPSGTSSHGIPPSPVSATHYSNVSSTVNSSPGLPKSGPFADHGSPKCAAPVVMRSHNLPKTRYQGIGHGHLSQVGAAIGGVHMTGHDPSRGSSTSGSSESLNSYKSPSTNPSPQLDSNRRGPIMPAMFTSAPASAFSGSKIQTLGDIGTFGSIKRRNATESYAGGGGGGSGGLSVGGGALRSSMHSGTTSSNVGLLPDSSSAMSKSMTEQRLRTVRTLYNCQAENDSELSFHANQFIYQVKPSQEACWLEGTLDGVTGLIPENYVEYVD
ncbi:rho GTPase-activating protein 26 [Octopus bimaculoides]|uniref:Rho GTPase-activating protein 26 n=1 Tax=Octopus bimaculoides TaxID=37653 RepID=A0A0L8FQ23_OCTBM|nr:rho GTPase-activating protein 26 [Octopus bimaculoides]|eukprot:XP_014787913.1 PREDICTED: rho GTPase-activating protein 26-like [Octopus bimaculoides]